MHLLSRELKIIFTVGYALLLIVGWYLVMDHTTPQVSAGITGNDLIGWAWSEHIGWISFNSANCDADGVGGSDGTPGCPALGTPIPNYGVTVDGSGFLSGHAWSEHIGWISFESGDVSGCPPTGGCMPRRLGSQLRGWARALSVSPSHGGNPSEGWDGWISLSCNNTPSECANSKYGVSLDSCNYSDFAWGGEVIGWISFSCEDQAGTCGVSNYQVKGSGNACGGGGCLPGEEKPHTTCQDNACVSVNTCGTSSCTLGESCTGGSCTPPGQLSPHSICDGSACVSVPACGVSSCATNAECAGKGSCSVPGESNPHSICISKTCVPLVGCGVSSCSTNVDCGSCPIPGQSSPYSTCDGSACVSVPACGVSSCATNAECAGGGMCVIDSFDASRDNINKGESIILSWSASTGCTDCTLFDDQGNIFVPPPSGGGSLHRSETVTPATTTVYTLSCSPGATPQTKSITVKQPPKFCEILPGQIVCPPKK